MNKVYDKGFHTGSELKTAQQLGVETIVAIPDLPSTSQAPNPLFNYEFFKYNREDDTYTCPGGQVLRTNGSWYKQRSGTGISAEKTRIPGSAIKQVSSARIRKVIRQTAVVCNPKKTTSFVAKVFQYE